MYPDGGGLYLQVTGAGARSWIFRYMLRGKERFMGLGSAAGVSLADARQKASDCRKLLSDGVDPIEVRKRQRQREALDAARALTFRACAEAYIAAHRAGWRNPKHVQQWENTLATYAYPVLGSLSAQAIDVGLVLKVLEPIWTVKPETASRLRGRIEAILDWAKARNDREGENPARWRGHLDQLLPRPDKVCRARALEFLILIAARTGEARGAWRDEIDLRGAVWTIPGIRAGRRSNAPNTRSCRLTHAAAWESRRSASRAPPPTVRCAKNEQI